ncbi:hypothetical protein NXS19_008406 [Fusarium pseudograminearum]|nr:hypothetical protein NXS19_008406 [Fusarium pseudograminearum]
MSTRRPRRLLAACHRCHSQKIKCSGDKPCQSCNSTGRAGECEFPANKERKVPVSESYLKKLEDDSRKLQAIASTTKHQRPNQPLLPSTVNLKMTTIHHHSQKKRVIFLIRSSIDSPKGPSKNVPPNQVS